MIDEQLESMFDSLISQSDARLDPNQIPGELAATNLDPEPRRRLLWPRFVFPLAIATVAVVGVLGISLLPSTSTAPTSTAPAPADDETTASVSVTGELPVQPTAGDVSTAPIFVRLNGETRSIEPDQIQAWVGADIDPDSVDWTVDQTQMISDLEARFELDSKEVSAAVIYGEVIAVPGQEPACCRADTAARMTEHLREVAENPGLTTPIELELETQTESAAIEQLEALGIVEEVSSFTTRHPCCANRVTNIHRFAELMNGVIIEPNSVLSLNEQVGPRTIENGFMSDGAIIDGEITTVVGGGVSQYATTFFNAWFFAGLEFEEYQSHSRYITRYPQGREATLSFPSPDLVVRNQTDYGVLVWSEWTDTSITVSLYSTQHIESTAGEVDVESSGECRTVTTPRIRRFDDGTVVTDSVSAIYQVGPESSPC